MDVRRLIIFWPKDGDPIWDTVYSLICFTNLILKIYPRNYCICSDLDTNKICYEHSIWDMEGQKAGCPTYVKSVDVHKFYAKIGLYISL